jgi:glycosyltransferase involved in cell wall biosynthesis
VIAAHFALYALPALDTLEDIPFVMHFHGPWARESEAEQEPQWKVRAKATLEGMVYKRANRLIVLSAAFRDVLTTHYNVNPDQVRIVPGGVNIDRFAVDLSPQAARDQLGWPTDRPIVLAVRRLVRRVGLDRLIDAIDIVRRHVPEVLLLIAGKGPLQFELEQQIRGRSLTDHARLIGFVPDEELPFAYRAADLSVVPTVAHEGFGLIVVESLAAGTPVLVTPVGGLPEIVSDLSENLLFPDGQPKTIADRIRQALDGTVSLPSARDCRCYARDHYDWAVIARQVRNVYEEVIS